MKRVHKLGIVFSFVLLIASDMPLKSESENRKNEGKKVDFHTAKDILIQPALFLCVCVCYF